MTDPNNEAKVEAWVKHRELWSEPNLDNPAFKKIYAAAWEAFQCGWAACERNHKMKAHIMDKDEELHMIDDRLTLVKKQD